MLKENGDITGIVISTRSDVGKFSTTNGATESSRDASTIVTLERRLIGRPASLDPSPFASIPSAVPALPLKLCLKMFFPIVATFRSTADTKLGKTSCRLENVANVDVGSSTSICEYWSKWIPPELKSHGRAADVIKTWSPDSFHNLRLGSETLIWS